MINVSQVNLHSEEPIVYYKNPKGKKIGKNYPRFAQCVIERDIALDSDLMHKV